MATMMRNVGMNLSVMAGPILSGALPAKKPGPVTISGDVEAPSVCLIRLRAK